MKSLFAKITSTAAGAIVLLVGCAMAGLGLTVIAVLAMFALAVLGLALLARPFMALSEQNADDEAAEIFRERPSAA